MLWIAVAGEDGDAVAQALQADRSIDDQALRTSNAQIRVEKHNVPHGDMETATDKFDGWTSSNIVSIQRDRQVPVQTPLSNPYLLYLYLYIHIRLLAEPPKNKH